MQKNTSPLKIISKIIKVDFLRGGGGGNQAEELINYSIAEPVPRVLLVEDLIDAAIFKT